MYEHIHGVLKMRRQLKTGRNGSYLEQHQKWYWQGFTARYPYFTHYIVRAIKERLCFSIKWHDQPISERLESPHPGRMTIQLEATCSTGRVTCCLLLPTRLYNWGQQCRAKVKGDIWKYPRPSYSVLGMLTFEISLIAHSKLAVVIYVQYVTGLVGVFSLSSIGGSHV